MASCAAGWHAALRAVRVSGDHKRKSLISPDELAFVISTDPPRRPLAGARQPVRPEFPEPSLALGALCVTPLDKRTFSGHGHRSPCLRASVLFSSRVRQIQFPA